MAKGTFKRLASAHISHEDGWDGSENRFDYIFAPVIRPARIKTVWFNYVINHQLFAYLKANSLRIEDVVLVGCQLANTGTAGGGFNNDPYGVDKNGSVQLSNKTEYIQLGKNQIFFDDKTVLLKSGASPFFSVIWSGTTDIDWSSNSISIDISMYIEFEFDTF